jgi:lipopolysaccharide transport system ATP-binding protein
MTDTAIRVERLGKRYQLGQRATYRRLTETLTALVAAPFGSFRNKSVAGITARSAEANPVADTFWALDDVSFEIKRGSVVGIIGRNGAGKSTLLKILSRITEPTTGDVWLHGRVGSLLEVGTGFHPELTGRENIFLNGAILGMKRREIQSKFDEIVAFSEVEKFLDTPVKHYSSGMYMRLAFSVAAHLEPEILLVDEVLAVGDAQFQAKCMGKMGEVAKTGRTVLFVSHNLSAIERLCDSVILLRKGKAGLPDKPADVIASYLGTGRQASIRWIREGSEPLGPHFQQAFLCEADGLPCATPTTNSQMGVCISFKFPKAIQDVVIALNVFNEQGHPIFSTSHLDSAATLPTRSGEFSAVVLFPRALFLPKRYWMGLSMYDARRSYDQIEDVLSFVVTQTASFGDLLPTGRIGDVQFQCDWQTGQDWNFRNQN